jgi:hypothetical protein
MSGLNEAISEYEQTERKHRENGMNAKRSGSYGGSPSAWLTDFRIESLLIQKVRKIVDATEY